MATRGEARGKTSPARVKLVYLDYFVTRCTCPNHDSDIEWKVANPRGAIEVKSGGGLRVVASRGSLLRLAFISLLFFTACFRFFSSPLAVVDGVLGYFSS